MDVQNEVKKPETKEKKDRRQFIAGILVGVLTMTVAMIIVVLLVSKNNHSFISQEISYTSKTGTVLDSDTIRKLEQIQSVIEENSIYDPSIEDLRKGMVEGILEGTGDLYATYYTQDQINDQMSSYSGKFYGIGVYIGVNDNEDIVIHEVFKDSPADKAGVHQGDIVRAVNGEDTKGWSLDEVVSKVRGKKGTKVTISVEREGSDDLIDLTPIRDEIEEVVIESKMLEDGIGYIHIEQWYDTTAPQFKEAKESLEQEGMNKGLVIDLRSNTGGLVSAAVEVLEVCLPAGPALYVENNKGERSTYSTYKEDEINIPVVILTNEYTASASEIFTGAMRDYGKAVTLGTKTFGKGIVQSFYYLFDDSALKLTTERYYTPNNIALDGTGIEPDIEVEFDTEMYYDEENPVDNQLEEAISYLKEK